MKRKSVMFSFVAVIAAVFLLTSASTSLDGRAVVAEAGELPEGLFAKTVGYLPGDNISVTNMLTRKTIEILVVGSLDASEGVAILLSPEAAEALDVVKNGNTVVKITKRSDEIDRVFNGVAVMAKGEETVNPSTTIGNDTVAGIDYYGDDIKTDAPVYYDEPEIVFEHVVEQIEELPEPEKIHKTDVSPFESDLDYYGKAAEDPLESVPQQIIETVESSPRQVVKTVTETYEPIVLVPVSPNPPAKEEPKAEAAVAVLPSSDILNNYIEEAAPKPVQPAHKSIFADYIVPDLRSLESGKYYVQIASLAENKSLDNVIEKYGKNYPLVLVPLSDGRTMQVMVGPLSVDEYEIIMTRFKSYGFADLFLRKIR